MRQYLSFYEKLSQIWLSEVVIVMVLVIFKVYFFTKVLVTAISAIGESSASTCLKMNKMLDQILNTLYEMSRASQYAVQYAMGVWVELIKALLSLSIKILKAVVGFLVDIYLGTLTCLCTAFVKGTLDLAADAVSTITEVVENAINTTMESTNSALGKLSLVVNGFITSFEAIKSLFSLDNSHSVTDAFESVSLSVNNLTKITIPTTFVDEISQLSDSIPDFTDVLSNITGIITLPLDALDKHIRALSVTNDIEILARNQSYNVLGSRCHELASLFDNMALSTERCSHYVLIGLGGATLLVLWFLVWLSYRNWARNEMLLEQLALEHLQVRIGNLLYQYDNRIIALITNNQDYRLQWLVSYMNTPTLRRCVLIGIGGIIAFGLQSMLLNIIDRMSKLLLNMLGDTDTTEAQLTAAMVIWTNETQGYIDDVQRNVNLEILNPIQTLSEEFLSAIKEVESVANVTVNTIFGNTPFASPLRTIIYCTVGRKLDTIEEGLKWLVTHTELYVPLYSNSQIADVGKKSCNEASENIADLADDIYWTIKKCIKQYRKILDSELVISSVFIGVWILMFLIGCAILLARSIKPSDVRSQVIGSPRPVNPEQGRQLGYPYIDPFVSTTSSSYYNTS